MTSKKVNKRGRKYKERRQ